MIDWNKENQKNNTTYIVGLIIISLLLSRTFMYFWFAYDQKSLDFNLFIQKMNIWDSGWYRTIGAELYSDQANDPVTGQAAWAFFPLYPVIIHFIYIITKIDMNYLASFFSTLLLGMAEFLGYQYIKMTRNDSRQGLLYIYFMSFGVYSFYFSVFYTESLYLFLLTCAFYFMQKGEYLKMGMAGALLSLTRNTGIFFCFVILVFWIKKYYKKPGGSIGGFVKETVCNYRLIAGTMLVPLGFFSYMVYLKYKVGDAFAFLHVQKAWWRQNVGMANVVGGQLLSQFPPGYLGICFLISVYFLTLLILKHRRPEEAVLPVITLIIASSSSLCSVPRYMVGSFTVVLAMTDEWKGCTRLNRILIGILLFVLEIICVNGWLKGSVALI